MQKIPLSRGYFALIDDEDYQRVSKYKWTYDNGYAVRGIRLPNRRYKKIMLHRFLINAKPGQFVDHIDGNRSNNTRSNLRICTKAQNGQNRHIPAPNKVSHYKGVSRTHNTRDRWQALIIANGKRHYLGSFPSQEEAARAYDTKARELHGEFAQLNFPHQS